MVQQRLLGSTRRTFDVFGAAEGAGKPIHVAESAALPEFETVLLSAVERSPGLPAAAAGSVGINVSAAGAAATSGLHPQVRGTFLWRWGLSSGVSISLRRSAASQRRHHPGWLWSQ